MERQENLLGIAGITCERKTATSGPFFLISAKEPLAALHSYVCGGGFQAVRHIVNRQVAYRCDDPSAEMETFLRENGIDPDVTAGLLTAARIEDAAECHLALDELRVSSWVTVGLGNTTRAGTTEAVERLYPGTINSIVLIDGTLTEAALVNAVMTATEAKAAALQDLGVTAKSSGLIATGTSTDAVVIAATNRGVRYRYAGSATRLGYLIGRAVYEAVKQSALTYMVREDGQVKTG